MNKYYSKLFGEIDLNNVKEYYEATQLVDKKEIEFDLNIVGAKTIEKELLELVDEFIQRIETHIDLASTLIYVDFLREGISKEFIEFYTEDLDDYEGLNALINYKDQSKSIEEQLLEKLVINRIGFYPEKEDDIFAVLDFCFDPEISNQILVFIFHNDMTNRITWES